MEEEEDYAQKPLLATSSSSAYDPAVEKTGNVWTTTAHIITAVIGSGVLSLAWSVAQLGWIAGPVSMLIFAGVTLVSSYLLADFYRSPDPETGSVINHTYIQSVRHHLGEKSEWACGLLQQIMLYGSGIAYTITSAISMRLFFITKCLVEGAGFLLGWLLYGEYGVTESVSKSTLFRVTESA